MKLQFKHQDFQADASNAVCNVFSGQPMTPSIKYMLDPGVSKLTDELFILDAFANQPIKISDDDLLSNIRQIQIDSGIKQSDELMGNGINLTIEMETGTGKTYTYIKTMYDLNKLYGWSKFIIVVPSVAIREGVNKSFQVTADHFQQEYGKKTRFFIYNSSNLNEVEQFATDKNINVMIMNMQAFNARGQDARRISMPLDSFKGRRPIDVISKTNPIIVLDEPQSMGGDATLESLKQFNALFTLGYSATHRNPYNMIYRLDALDAYNRKLVKKIAVKGISVVGDFATGGYVYLSGIDVSKTKAPTANLEIDVKGVSGITKKTLKFEEGDNLYSRSKELDEYKTNWTITRINAADNFVEFANGIKLLLGDVHGNNNEEQLRRLQIRETIRSHLEREEELFNRGIKVLSLFFIDEVSKYRSDDDKGGIYAQMFEQEYQSAVSNKLSELNLNPEYKDFLSKTDAQTSHQGYFSIDKKGKLQNSKTKGKETSASSDDDVRAYDLIMKDKERLLSRSEPVRFIFSHSALREGWDNPNVFQICTLKQSSNDISRRQEIGRGLRLCVDQNGERMDAAVLGPAVQKINVLTVVASESYEKFVTELQKDIAANLTYRARYVNAALFEDKKIKLPDGTVSFITHEQAVNIYEDFIRNGYVHNGKLTDEYQNALKEGSLKVTEGFAVEDIVAITSSIYKPIEIENLGVSRVDVKLNKNNFDRKEFQELWNKINVKSAYKVSFDTDELIDKAVNALNKNLRVSKLTAVIRSGTMGKIESKTALEQGMVFSATKERREDITGNTDFQLSYDLLDRIVKETGLTRRVVADIFTKIMPTVFEQFAHNPEEFIIKSSAIINDEKATSIIEQITYNKLDATYDSTIFTEPNLKGSFNNTVETPFKHIYDHVITDSNVERDMAKELEIHDEVCVYAKLPNGFKISTPVGSYNPDWAISFVKGSVKYIYFIAETKGSMRTLDLKGVEYAKIKCAKKHFAAISNQEVKYDVVKDYKSLFELVTD